MEEGINQEDISNHFFTGILKMVAGVIGGGIGTLIIFLLTTFTIGPLLTIISGDMEKAGAYSSIILVLSIIILVGTTIGNILSALFIALTEKEKFKSKKSISLHILVMEILVFLIMVPLYFIISGGQGGIEVSTTMMLFHIIFTVQTSALFLEIVGAKKQATAGIYAVSLGMLFSIVVLGIIGAVVDNGKILLLFISMPVIWGFIGLADGMVSTIFSWFKQASEEDFLKNRNSEKTQEPLS